MTLGDPINVSLEKTIKVKKGKKWYIGERHNPQFDKPYYVTYGQLSKTEASRKEKSIYGSMYVLEFNTQQEYENKINELKLRGFRVH